jgi:ribosomal protein S18 acetylase RimI-like enzyme
MTEAVRLSRHDATSAATMRDELIAVYQDAYGAAFDLSDPFLTPRAFGERLDGHLARAGFLLVLATVEDQPVGYVYGYPLPPETRWFETMTPPLVPAHANALAAGQFLAINEIMVRPGYQRRGIAAAAHAEYLAGRTQRHVTLLVLATNTPAYTAYRSWGYRKLGVLVPDPNHQFDCLIHDLPPR